MANIKVVVEKHPDGYVAYPLGLKGVVVGEGDTYESALSDVTSGVPPVRARVRRAYSTHTRC